MPNRKKGMDKLKYEFKIAKKIIGDQFKMSPSERISEANLQKAMKSSLIDKELINRGRRLDLETRVNKDIQNRQNKARKSSSSASRKIIK